ncbi:TonB-dependent receptor plug domain-containing protein [Flavobacterium oreochromis]|uniref:TonB-dependent receptor n=1 Tax=Flavobacterium oreochromis TaxID=2906078 RepID=A0ABW8PCJ2_9FLAO|nr:TonB-dependent receptor [Flavobacterium oreochromis]OWP77133.1 TonB-dependent receptor [Flavobacterium oreochromis]
MRKMLLPIIGICFFANAQGIQEKKDSIKVMKEIYLQKIQKKKKIETDLKLAVSIDEFLASSNNISFIKRGAYAWEPLLNNMSSERSTITIDGMHIFGACTDKMDPVTSYLEVNNLATIDIKSGQQGGLHGATVAGNINLVRKNSSFAEKPNISGSFQGGFESNNHQLFNLGAIAFTNDKLVFDGTIAYREAGNYFDGNNNEVKHSQYSKFNSSLGVAYKTGLLSSLKVDAIFDMAKNVGFPALPMDLYLSRTLITSAAYKKIFEDKLIKVWDTKVYFNTIEHYMDDTTRPENLVHMDMPGWSTTYGLVSKMNLKKNQFSSEVQLNGYNNLSIAEMRMYPQDRSKRTMFAYTWPWVTTKFASLAIQNSWDFSDKHQLSFGSSFGVNYNFSKYVEFNWIFYPNSPQEKIRFLPSLNLKYQYKKNNYHFSVGTGYGHRAPSISEGYGYYIYNSFDRYDYIGNPNLKNEISYEVNANIGYKNDIIGIESKANYFYIQNYIVGKILSLGSPMNYQSIGVKGYTSLDYAKLYNISVTAFYYLTEHIRWETSLTYARGLDSKQINLPFIRPLTYLTSLQYKHCNFGLRTSINGDLDQIHFSSLYGEDRTPQYLLWNSSMDYTIPFDSYKMTLQLGAENMLNKNYSTYADWGNINRMGRNIFISFKLNF